MNVNNLTADIQALLSRKGKKEKPQHEHRFFSSQLSKTIQHHHHIIVQYPSVHIQYHQHQ